MTGGDAEGMWSQAMILLQAMRPIHWSKNLLVFAPLVFALRAAEPAAWQDAAVAFVALSLVASGLYLMNDLLDVEADRRHAWKRYRPVARAALPAPRARLVVAGLLSLGSAVGFSLGGRIVLPLGAYAALSAAYTLWLKHLRLMDCLTLALLFVLRLAIGAAAIPVMVSPWLAAWAFALFLSPSLAKRLAELGAAGGAVPGRPYRQRDRAWIVRGGIAAGLLAVAVLANYALWHGGPGTLYRAPALLWLLPLLMALWLGRLWRMVLAGRLEEDVVTHAIRDGTGLAIGLALILAWLAAAPSGLG